MKSLLALIFSFSLTSAFAGVSFVTPKDKETVPTTFTVEFKVEGMSVAKAGTTKEGTGHHHLIVDGTPITKGEIVPKDATHIHFGDGATSTKLTLKPGDHTLVLQFADGLHKSLGEDFATKINVTVK
jgi:hypothetical protein